MRCLFCKNDSTGSKSIEHIVPESLGNKSLTLPVGYVCDSCNNYFARKVEKPFMEIPAIRQMRFQLDVPNKKKRVPSISGVFNNGVQVKLKKMHNNSLAYVAEIEPKDLPKMNNNVSYLFTDAFSNETKIDSDKTVSRFIGKIALEALAEKLMPIENSLNDLIDNSNSESIRRHVRYGEIDNWPCSIRRIYDYDKEWENNGETIQKVCEYDFLVIPSEKDSEISKDNESILIELFFVIVIWGMEYAINLGGPDIKGYTNWLEKNNCVSPLYFENKTEE